MTDNLAQRAQAIEASQQPGFIELVFEKVDALMVSYVETTFTALVTSNYQLLVLLVALYIAAYGWLVMTGRTANQPTLMEFCVEAGRIGIILSFVLSWAFFYEIFYRFFIDVPPSLVASLMRIDNYFGSTNMNQAASLFFTKSTMVATETINMGSLTQAWIWLLGLFIWVLAMLISASTIGLLMVPKVLGGILLALAPLFFAFLLFSSTRGLFEGWLRILFGTFLLPLLLYSLLGISLHALKPSLVLLQDGVASGTVDAGHASTFILMAFVLLYLFKKIDGIAMTIAGGFVARQYKALDGRVSSAIKKWQQRRELS